MSCPLVKELRGYQGHKFVEHVLLNYPELLDLFHVGDESPQLPLSDAHGMDQSRVEQRGAEQSPEKPARQPQDVVSSPALNRARRLFRMKDSTPLDSGQDRAWKKNKAAVEVTTEEQWLALEWYYGLSQEPGANVFLRQDLATLLNNFNGEVIRARAHAVKLGKKIGEKKEAAEIPSNWKAILTELDPEFNAPDHFEQLPESVRSLILAEDKKRKGGGGEKP